MNRNKIEMNRNSRQEILERERRRDTERQRDRDESPQSREEAKTRLRGAST